MLHLIQCNQCNNNNNDDNNNNNNNNSNNNNNNSNILVNKNIYSTYPMFIFQTSYRRELPLFSSLHQ